MVAYRYLLPILAALGGCADDPAPDCSQVIRVPLQPIGRMYTVPVTVDGHDLHLMLDTGDSLTMLSEKAVQQWHIPQSGRTSSASVGMAGGSLRSDADVTSVTIGGVTIPVDHLTVNSWNGSDGLLGLDILGKYDLDIDGPNRTLGLYPAHCVAVPPWSPATLVVGTSKTLWIHNRWLEMPIEIDGVPSMGIVDTGSSYTTIRAPMMRKLGLTEADLAGDKHFTTHVTAGADPQVYAHKFHTIRLGPVTAHDVAIEVYPGEPPALGGGLRAPGILVGQDLLRDRHVWFSWSTGRLYL